MTLPELPYVTWDGTAHTRDKDTLVEEMLMAYLECAVWADKPDEEDWAGAEFAPEAINNARFECTAFLKLANWAIEGWGMKELGHNFWLTRNHHGAGFWDSDSGTEAQRKELTNISHVFRETDVFLGDDGKLYI